MMSMMLCDVSQIDVDDVGDVKRCGRDVGNVNEVCGR